MTPFEVSFRMYGITVFINALVFAIVSLLVGNITDFFMSFVLLFVGVLFASPLLVILTQLMKAVTRIPYSNTARAGWLVWWMSVSIAISYATYFRLLIWAVDLAPNIMAGITIVAFIVTFVLNRKSFTALIAQQSWQAKKI
jgi:hypothetical protein